jgi:hypothetical protein
MTAYRPINLSSVRLGWEPPGWKEDIQSTISRLDGLLDPEKTPNPTKQQLEELTSNYYTIISSLTQEDRKAISFSEEGIAFRREIFAAEDYLPGSEAEQEDKYKQGRVAHRDAFRTILNTLLVDVCQV